MATGYQRVPGDARRYPSSSTFTRSENRPSMNTTLCRNGPQCRKFQEGTCNFNHDFSSVQANGLNAPKRSLNVDSPAFTPTLAAKTTNTQLAKPGISPKAATAAAFTPRESGSMTPMRTSHSKEPSEELHSGLSYQQAPPFNDFVPGQPFVPHQQTEPQSQLQSDLPVYSDPFMPQGAVQSLDSGQTQLHLYGQQATNVGAQPYYQDTTIYKFPLNYHLYASIGPRRENLMAYQRSTADFFLPDNLREDLQRKAEATIQTFSNSTLPQNVEYFHSLVALDTNSSHESSIFGFPNWVYKAVSSRDGHTYALRRIEGFRLTNEAAIRTVQHWKRITNSSLVQVHDAFTGRWFNDSSLIVVTDYHPLAQTLAEKHNTRALPSARLSVHPIPETDLWKYIVQISSALKAIHDGGQAARTVAPSKVLVTSKHRLRLNGCAILDIVQHEQQSSLTDLQRADLEALGKLILGLATKSNSAYTNLPKALDSVSRSYSERLRACLSWLLLPPTSSPTVVAQQAADYNIDSLLNSIADKVISAFDSTLHLEDELTTNLMCELENGRLVRLLTKFNVILERPETNPGPSVPASSMGSPPPVSSAWSETGERYYLKLFRDYVFHQVDHEGRPVLDLGHIVACLNKLDAGIDEKIQLVSRDEQNVFVVSYREVKRGFESAWADLSKASNSATRRGKIPVKLG